MSHLVFLGVPPYLLCTQVCHGQVELVCVCVIVALIVGPRTTCFAGDLNRLVNVWSNKVKTINGLLEQLRLVRFFLAGGSYNVAVP